MISHSFCEPSTQEQPLQAVLTQGLIWGHSPGLRGLGCGHWESPLQPPYLQSARGLFSQTAHVERHLSRRKGSLSGGWVPASNLALTVIWHHLCCHRLPPPPDLRGGNLDPTSQRGSFSVCVRTCGTQYVSVAIFGGIQPLTMTGTVYWLGLSCGMSVRPKEELADSPGKSFVFHVSILLFPYIRSRYGCHCIKLTLLDMAVMPGAVAAVLWPWGKSQGSQRGWFWYCQSGLL